MITTYLTTILINDRKRNLTIINIDKGKEYNINDGRKISRRMCVLNTYA